MDTLKRAQEKVFHYLIFIAMKKLALILGFFLAGIAVQANPAKNHVYARGYDGNAFIFQEGTVEFSVFPDGQFDFVYIGPQKSNRVIINSPNMNISFNSGYNYDAYVQYDIYGAVIQVEEVPIYYDHYGRIIQAGNVEIRYHDNRLVAVGGLHIFYNSGGYYSHYTGYINSYNRHYVYRPWHVHYVRPYYTHVIVYDYPYRMHYHPVRYTYVEHVRLYNNRGRSNYVNGRREFYRPGSRTHLDNGTVVRNPNFDPNRKNTMIADGGRNNAKANTSASTTNTGRNNASTGRNNATTERNNATSVRTNESNPSRTSGVRSNTTTPVKSPANGRTIQSSGTRSTGNTNAAQNSRTTVQTRSSAPQNTRTVTPPKTTPTRAATPVKAAPTQQRTPAVRSTPAAPARATKTPAATPARNAGSRGNSNSRTTGSRG